MHLELFVLNWYHVLGIYIRAKRPDVTASLAAYARCTVAGGADCQPGFRYIFAMQFLNIVNAVSVLAQ